MSSLAPIGWQPPTEVTGITPTTMASPPPTAYLQGTLSGVASMLSMSPTDLRAALKQGSSIADLAQQKGVSRDSIVQYIEQQVQQQRSSQGQQPVDAATLDRVVNKAVDRHRHGHHHHHAPVTPPSTDGTQPAPVDPGTATASTLDLLA